ncbi:MAG: hypothetical protein JWP12_3190 [Bacteroidetes bacterium]|nr:hypothetical protein [Bacteroidota bacterium]
MSQQITNSYGGNGGNAFSAGTVNSIGLFGCQDVDAIVINNTRFGGGGGDPSSPGSITLADNEYINYVKIAYDNNEYVYYLKISTNLNHSLEIGNSSKGTTTELTNIRLLSIDGKADRYLDKITLTYIDGYQPSSFTADSIFILDWTPQNSKMIQYQAAEMNTLNSYEKVSSTMNMQEYSASAEVDYGVKASASTKLTFQNTNTETIKSEIQNKLTTALTVETNILPNQIGVMLVTAKIMQSGSEYWMYPTNEPQYTVLSMDNVQSLQNTYDLTGVLFEQVPALAGGRTAKYGYTYYGS